MRKDTPAPENCGRVRATNPTVYARPAARIAIPYPSPLAVATSPGPSCLGALTRVHCSGLSLR